MKILNINGYYHVRGGSDQYMLSLEKLLTTHGQEVIPFATINSRNLATPYNKYFPSGPFSENSPWKTPLKVFYNREAKEALKILIRDTQPDIAHLHIYYGNLTVSILEALREENIPVVQTLHEYKLICPVYTLNRNGIRCNSCAGKMFYKAALNRCKDGKLLRSSMLAGEAYFSRKLGDLKLVDHFITVSEFQKREIINTGIVSVDRVTAIHNFIDQEPMMNRHQKPGEYFLYFGRLDVTKGLRTLLKAFAGLPDVPLKIAGSGPLEKEIKDFIDQKNCVNIEFLGFKKGKDLETLIRNAIASILPSEWPETFGLTLLESFANARPAIISNMGGMTEIVEQNLNGLHFESGKPEELQKRVINLFQKKNAIAIEMGYNGLKTFREKFNKEVHYEKIMNVYNSVVEKKNSEILTID